MNKLLKYFLCIVLSFTAGNAYSQDTSLLDRLYDDLSSRMMTLDISYIIESSADIQGEGTVSFQENAYMLSAGGLDVYCDGRDRWIVDTYSKEVMIEPVCDDDQAFIQNPALLFAGLEGNFKVADVSEGGHIREPGVKDVVYTLVPEVECGIGECEIQIKKDGDLYYGTFVISDGQVDIVRVCVRSVKRSDKKDVSCFRPKQTFDSSWIVTDLR